MAPTRASTYTLRGSSWWAVRPGGGCRDAGTEAVATHGGHVGTTAERGNVARNSGLGRNLSELLPLARRPPGTLLADGQADERGEGRGATERDDVDDSDPDEAAGPGSAGLAPSGPELPPEGAEPVAVTEFGSDLVAELATQQSGLALIYRILDGLVAQFGLRDAAIVIEEPGLGRQVFRAGRRPLDDERGEALLSATAGLYTEPELEPGTVDVPLIESLCVVALRLDVLRYDSWHDPLTDLFDRRSFDRLLEMSVARSLRYKWPFTLVLIDLDHLKQINDTEGHAAGDAALVALAERFRRVLRYGDNAARIGGDEFALILPNTDPDDVPALLERIGSSRLGERPCPAFSYGVAQCPTEADDAEELFRLADRRLYEAKAQRP